MSSNTDERALEMLGANVPQESVAAALGVTPGYISQLLANEDFAAQVTQLRYEALTKHNDRDRKYDTIEDRLLDKLDKNLPLFMRPGDILGALKVINAAKRRGLDSVDSSIVQNNLVQLTMPTKIVQNFTTNIHNQVVKAGDQDLVTIDSGQLRRQVENKPKTIEHQKQTTNEESNEAIEEDSILASL